MPYDAPMSWEEMLADPETRRRALEFAGAQPETVAVPPMGEGAGNRFPEPAGTTGTTAAEPSDLIRRYLEAQGMDAKQERLNSLSSGFDNAAETILGGVGVRYARGQPQAPHAAQDVLEAERVRAMAEKAAQPKAPTGKPPAMTDEQARAVVRERYPKAKEALISNVTAGNFEEVMKDLRAGAGVEERAGAMTRREEMEKQRLEQAREEGRLRRSVDWARLGQQAEENGASRGFRRYIFEREQDAKEKERAEKTADKEKALNVEGYDVAPGATPTLDDAKKLKDTSEAALRMQGAIGNLRGLQQKYGGAPKGTGANLQQQALRAVQIEAKTIAGLGALSGPDFGLMQDLSAQDLTSIPEWVRRNFTGASLEESLQGLEQWMNTIVGATAKARGYSPRAADAPPRPKRTPIRDALPPDASGTPSLSASGKIKVRNKTTGESLWFDSKTAYRLLSKPDKFERGE